MAQVISNTSPLVVLAKADLLWVLPEIFDKVFVPRAVLDEIRRGPQDDPMRRLLPGSSWLQEVTVDPPLSPLAEWQLGAGESQVLEYARRHPGNAVMLDDLAARRAASGLGLTVHGTLSILAMACKRGHLPSFHAAAGSIKSAGLYISPGLVDQIEEGLEG